jgi:recombinational DNA repair ATPase RecF
MERKRLEYIEINNYKCIDHLRIEFPQPPRDYIPDVWCIGSKNGVGKTSVLECCALLLLAAGNNLDKSSLFQLDRQGYYFRDSLIRSVATALL